MHYANKIFPGFDFILLQIVLQEIEIMNQGKTVFAQIMSLIPRYEFDKCVKRYNGNRHAIEFKCRDQFMVMSFAQFTGQDSLRSIDVQRWLPCPSSCTRPESNISNARLWHISTGPRTGASITTSVRY